MLIQRVDDAVRVTAAAGKYSTAIVRLPDSAADEPGFWERNGYHMYGDPFVEQRHWGD